MQFHRDIFYHKQQNSVRSENSTDWKLAFRYLTAYDALRMKQTMKLFTSVNEIRIILSTRSLNSTHETIFIFSYRNIKMRSF